MSYFPTRTDAPFPLVLASLCVLAFCQIASADQWASVGIREFTSESGKYALVVTPNLNFRNPQGKCTATLFKVDNSKREEVWSRSLINTHAPVQVFVADSGEYILTMDEWHAVGTLPVVIYGARGDLIKAHTTDSLGLKAGSQHIKRTVSSYWWNEDSVSFFRPQDDAFLIRLHWGKWIVIALRDGKLLEDKAFQNLKAGKLETLVVSKLASKDGRERKTGALIAGQESIRKAIPRLKELLMDASSFIRISAGVQTTIYFVRKAAKEALEAMGETVGSIVVEEPVKK